MRKLKSILQSRYLFKIICIIFIIYALVISNFYQFESKYDSNTNMISGVIDKYEIDGNKLTIYLKAKEMLIVNYYINNEKEKEYFINNLELGDKIRVDGVLEEASDNTVPNLFSYKKYLYYNKIFFMFDASNIKKVRNNSSIFYYIKNKIIDRIEKIDESGYLKVFILGDKADITEEVMSNYQVNGVSHLFSISGMHISVIAGIILFVLNKFSYNNKVNYLVVILFLLFYLFLTRMNPSVLRSVTMFILFGINKCYNLKMKSIDLMLLVLVVAIIINPLYIYNVGFQFSYLISFTLVILSYKLKNITGKLKNSLYISWVCFLVSFPIAIYNFYQVNVISIFLNIILIPMVSVIIYPLSLLSFVFPILINLFYIVVDILEFINNFVSDISLFQVVFVKPSILVIFIYYIAIYLGLFNKKYLWMFFVMLIIHKSYIYLDNRFMMVAIDVGQGDCIFLKLPNNKGNILIDTGGIITYNNNEWSKRESNYSISESKIIPYLKSIGIKRLDYLVITHGDYDHMGESVNLVNNFKVDRVIFNNNEYNNLELELIKVLDEKNIGYYQNIKELNIDNNKLYFLNNELYNNENDNSNVIYFNYEGIKMLLMGDAGVEVEEKILNKYNLTDIDILKVGHHGSKTSSSKEFINNINPEYSVISVGRNNRYGHPNREVLNALEESKIYRTDQDGSIMFKIKNNKLKIDTCAS